MDRFFERLSRKLKWAYNPHGRGPEPLQMLLVVNPIVMLPMTVMMGGIGEHFWGHYFYAVLVGDGVSSVCMATQVAIGKSFSRFFNIQLQRRTYIMIALASMFPGLLFAFWFADRFLQFFGKAPSFHRYSDYGTGWTLGAIIFIMLVVMDLWLQAKTRANELETESLQAKLSALSAQMNPHLLFNALNTIASAIPSDPRAAEEITLKLSELYRGVLASSKRTTHALSEELELCRAYLGIETARFGERLSWTIDAEPGVGKSEIPALLIQPLVENAIKHGISQRASGGNVRVRAFREAGFVQISVEDDGVGIGNSRSQKGTGTGVSSCRSRLELFYAGRASFEIGPGDQGAGTRVLIRVPAEGQK
jgi:signal transduction histidine kinase